MKGICKFILILCLAGYLGNAFFIHDAYAGEVEVIANKDAPADQMAPDAIKKIFLGDIINWPNNEVIMVVLSKDNETHEAFLQQYIKRTPSQFKNVWRQNLFTGKGAMSTTLQDNNEVVDYVSKTKGSIGYVSAGISLPADVKIIDK